MDVLHSLKHYVYFEYVYWSLLKFVPTYENTKYLPRPTVPTAGMIVLGKGVNINIFLLHLNLIP